MLPVQRHQHRVSKDRTNKRSSNQVKALKMTKAMTPHQEQGDKTIRETRRRHRMMLDTDHTLSWA